MQKDVERVIRECGMTKDRLTPSPKGLFGGKKYDRYEVGELRYSAFYSGVTQGLHQASVQGQVIHAHSSATNERQREYLRRMDELSLELKCGIQYHPDFGVQVVDLSSIFNDFSL